ncbi:FAD-binding and (Fe-S)-binding domain-containing protein [Plebeiibacterium sediminum]|uniref:FAD-binding oxidoreductase n=1 Tax=Plebeiibacterium sediminum TaxID=2992112 RepID=A0AAE3M6W9_9BACT|nr:FAD-binding and (Fe-S)-binding domain-containing protein [Plebeiobacterium sediminum]MCW3788022.1 FAD-binding oxidoreductase [Plebeiobacterium sediminum]
MDNANIQSSLNQLSTLLKGDVSYDNVYIAQFATDASAYREKPLGIVWPRDKADLDLIVEFAQEHKIALIPRGAGTSLAGQVVGNDLVVNTSKYMNRIIELNQEENWVMVEPGVVLDELNKYLEPHGLFFGPETSTSSRCTLGGMVGNNSCGSHSLIYGSTRDHLLEVHGYLANGQEVIFKELNEKEFQQKCKLETLEGDIYREVNEILSDKHNIKEIFKEYPHQDIKRRNTGYALDILAGMQPFDKDGVPFNMSKLIAGSEGTLMMIHRVKLNLVPTPPKYKSLLCAHFNSLKESLEANILALKHQPRAVELIDDKIIDLAGKSTAQQSNRFFITGKPAALLVIEFAEETQEALDQKIEKLTSEFQKNEMGYAYPVVDSKNMGRVWALRKSGLGVLSNMKGDDLPVAVIEDTALHPKDLPAYAKDISDLLSSFNKECVFYAHVGSGELHLRPVLNLKDPQDIILFRKIAKETALLVKKYKGSLSGEHGDGRLRGEFIPLMIGDINYKLLLRLKKAFDPEDLLNPNKIVNTPPMSTSLRYRLPNDQKKFKTVFNWDDTEGIVRATEKCSGSGDCLKSEIIGGTMCPSYMASKDEKLSTRGRANVLREYFTGTLDSDNLYLEEVYDVLSLCLSCKACKSECPSGVDIAKLKAEFLQYYYNQKGTPTSAISVGYSPVINRLFSYTPWIYNFVVGAPGLKNILQGMLGFSTKRDIPKMSNKTLKTWAKWHKKAVAKHRTVYLFADEFTNYLESDLGVKTILLLEKLGYRVVVPQHIYSGRTYISKGLIKKARKIANKNIELLSPMISKLSPLIGIEPSAVLTFRDEYINLVKDDLKEEALKIKRNTYTIEEFLANEMNKGRISKDSFTNETKEIKFHGHCYQKALSSTKYVQQVLSFPENYSAIEIDSGCCGMAGSFGYEKKSYSLSLKIAEMKLLPEVRNTEPSTLIAASGTSCRHQIKDGTGREAQHPIEILYEALL